MPRPILVVDVETTGVDPATDSLVEIGACLLEPDDLDQQQVFHILVRPTCSVKPEALRVHGLSEDMLAHAPDVSVALSRFLEFAPHNSLLEREFS